MDKQTSRHAIVRKMSLENENMKDLSVAQPQDSEENFSSDIIRYQHLIRDIFNQKVSSIENNPNLNEVQRNKKKMVALESFIKQLLEQNNYFATTMIELRTESEQRVQQMDKRLKNSAKTTMEAVINMHEYEKEIKRLVEERMYIETLYKKVKQQLSALKVENSFLRDQNSNLNHDVQALLHVIQHARSTGHWEMDCVTFCEVTPEQVFGPVQSISQNYRSDTDSQSFSRDSKRLSTNSEPFSQDAISRYTSSPHHSQIPSRGKVNYSPVHRHSSYLPRCASLPEIGNIYNFSQAVHKTNSYDTNDNKILFGVNLSNRRKIGAARNAVQTPELLKNVSCVENLEERLCNRKSQSEPHLFMFDGNVYKYTPCEPMKTSSNNALNENYQSSLPPYQSIDLKFPTEGSTLKINIWNKLKSGSYLDEQENSYLKAHSTDLSCSCSESDVAGLNCYTYRFLKQNSSPHRQPNTSIGLQAEADTVTTGTQVIPHDLPSLEEDCHDSYEKQTYLIEALKADINKAIIHEEQKSVLLGDLQNHVNSAFQQERTDKQVELRNKALENLEKKLQNSRDECVRLKSQVNDLNCREKIADKRFDDACTEIENLNTKVQQQSYLIRSLQDALVQSKRALDAAEFKESSDSIKSKNRKPSKSSIIDV